MNELIQTIVSRWTDPARRPLFRGSLIDDDGCCCAQGDILRHECKTSDARLKDMGQGFVDKHISELLGISRFHSVLLRMVNDSQDGCPQDVLTDPEKVLGPHWHLLLSFGWWINDIPIKEHNGEWYELDRAKNEASMAASLGADQLIYSIVRRTAGRMGDCASGAILEIMGAKALREQGKPFLFLPMFGFAAPEDIPLVDVFRLNDQQDHGKEK